MTQTAALATNPHITVDIASALSPKELDEICNATEAAIAAGGGFGWINVPPRETLERYWHGVMAMPQRTLIVARMDGVICGAIQLVEPTRHNEAQTFCATILASFVAPWARGRGCGRRLLETVEKVAIDAGYTVLQLDVRETQEAAIALYEETGWVRWGANPAYAQVNGRMITGYYYFKTIARKKLAAV